MRVARALFLKLGSNAQTSSRSAKDAITKDTVTALFKQLCEDAKVADNDYNGKLIALTRAGTGVL